MALVQLLDLKKKTFCEIYSSYENWFTYVFHNLCFSYIICGDIINQLYAGTLLTHTLSDIDVTLLFHSFKLNF